MSANPLSSLLPCVCILLLSACASQPPAPVATLQQQHDWAHAPDASERQRIVAMAHRSLGAPYRYGGNGPRGFDCSGLVQFTHAQAGIAVPRTAAAQRARARGVHPASLRQGDLVFFRLDGSKISHVGIYIGAGQFIHAPSSGKRVSVASLHNPYWNQRLAGAGSYLH